jgi:heat shock protein HtpX
MASKTFFAVRALLALMLMIGFYALSLAVVVALLWIAWFVVADGHYGAFKLAIGALGAAAIVLTAILPRRDRFEVPGPRLTAAEHPQLFQLIREVSEATGEAAPSEVYLVNDANAAVAQRGGVMGLGSRRVMLLGLPLLQTFTVSQLRAVLAHELGHFHGGDTMLGPWIYVTSAAIGRAIHKLSATSSPLRKPFEWYGVLFLRVTQAIRRRQELAADQLAARVAGATPLVEALERSRTASMAFGIYWRREVVPVLDAGYQPPIAAGFQHFIAAKGEAVSALADGTLAEDRSDPYDSHPSLSERSRAVEGMPGAVGIPDERSALDLLGVIAASERSMLAAAIGIEVVEALKPVAWEAVGEVVHRKRLLERCARYGADLAGRCADVPATPEALTALGRSVLSLEMPSEALDRVPGVVLIEIGKGLVGAAVAAVLIRLGWEVISLPGEAIALVRGAQRFPLFAEYEELIDGTRTRSAWIERCAEVGIGDAPLRPVAA